MAGRAATVWLSGATVGKSYEVTNHVVTDRGRVDERSFWVVVRTADPRVRPGQTTTAGQ